MSNLDWETVRLGDVATVNMGQSPPSSTVNEDGDGPPFIQGNAEFGAHTPQPVKYCSKPQKEAQLGDILLSVRAPVGALNLADTRICIGRGLSAITATGVESTFLWHALRRMVSGLVRVSQGSTFAAVNKTDLCGLKLPLPSPAEQRKIAAILSSVDDAIEKTQAVIDQVQVVKRGLMQELLTRGLPGRHTRFKQTEIGEIPEVWEVKLVQEVFEVLDRRRKPLNKSQRESMRGPYPYYGANGVVDHVSDWIFDEPLILMAEDGGYFDEYRTRPIAYMVDGKCWVNNHAHVLRTKDGFNNSWFYYSLVHRDVRPFINAATRSKLNQADLNSIPIPVPSLSEQTEISTILSSLDEVLQRKQAYIDQVQVAKSALMSVLLTGELRVAPDIKAA